MARNLIQAGVTPRQLMDEITVPQLWLILGVQSERRVKVAWPDLIRQLNERRKLKGLPPVKRPAHRRG